MRKYLLSTLILAVLAVAQQPPIIDRELYSMIRKYQALRFRPTANTSRS